MAGGQAVPGGYQPQGQGQADQQFQSTLQSGYGVTQGLPGQIAPQAQQFASNITNNPYNASGQAGVNQTAGIGASQIAPQSYAGSSALQQFGDAGQAGQYGAQILQQGFDPQGALYARDFQRNQDQTNAVNAMYGLGSSPYGAGVANQSNQNFNLDWTNNQLARENSAIQGYSGLGSAIGGAYTGASNLGNAGLQTGYSSAIMPGQNYNTTQGNNFGALNSYSGAIGGAMAPGQGLISDLATYLGLGQGATGLQQQATEANNAQANAMWSGLGSIFGLGTGGGNTIGGSIAGFFGL